MKATDQKPTPAQIEKRAQLIRAKWTPVEEERRRVLKRGAYQVPVVRLSGDGEPN